MNSQLSLSIIIPSLNSEKTIYSCINALKIWRNKYEIILVDAMSQDKTIKIAKEFGSYIRQTNPENCEKTGARPSVPVSLSIETRH